MIHVKPPMRGMELIHVKHWPIEPLLEKKP